MRTVLDTIQDFHAKWLDETFPENDSDDQLKGVLEEIGELARAELKNSQKFRNYSDGEIKEKITDAIGDLFFYMCGYCSRKGIRLADCIDMALKEIVTRDWEHLKKTGEKRYNKMPAYMDKIFWG